jgi:hypothetical protein
MVYEEIKEIQMSRNICSKTLLFTDNKVIMSNSEGQ